MKRYNMPKRLLAACILTLSTFAASAASITIDFTGVLTSGFGSLMSGDAFSGSYTFDPSVSARTGGTSSSAVFDNLLDASLTIGAFSAEVGPGAGLPEIQQDNVAGADRYALVARDAVGSSQIGGFDISTFLFRLDDTIGTAISDATILLNPPLMSSFTSNLFFIFFVDPDPSNPNPEVVTGALETLSVRNSTVPEPGSLLLLSAAAVLSRFARRGTKKVNC